MLLIKPVDITGVEEFSPPKLIAIIDDDEEIVYIYNLILEELIAAGRVLTHLFVDVREFKSWLQTNQPDLIISDISMPHITGPELGHCIRAMGLTIPTYFVSGHSESEYAEQLKEIGGYRYFTKPINTSDFLQSLKTDLGIKG